MKNLQNFIHHALARSRVASLIASKVRNQANCVIAYYLGETADPERNGEFQLLEHLAPTIKTFVDVGANVGAWSGHLLHLSQAKGFLFEPSTQCVKRLEERFRGRDVVIREVAVSDHVGVTSFWEEDGCGEGSSFSETRTDSKGQQREVVVTTLDGEFAGSELSIDFLKIDTEGYDLKVLKGAGKLLAKTRFVQFEYNSHWMFAGSTLADAIRFLGELGFQVLLIRSTGLHPFRYDVWQDFFRYSNFLAARSEDLETLRGLLREAI